MSSYAPLLAKEGHTNWNPDLIYFNNTEVKPTANYYVQRAFGQNGGDEYVFSTHSVDYTAAGKDKPLLDDIANRIDKSVVIDSKTGDIIVKLVSMLPKEAVVTVNIGEELTKHNISGKACLSLLAAPQQPDRNREWAVNETKQIDIAKEFTLTMPAFSFAVIRIGK